MRLRCEPGLTRLFISHSLAVVELLATRMSAMYPGRLVEEAPTRELFRKSRSPDTRALFGSVLTPEAGLGLPHAQLSIAYPKPIHSPSGCTFHRSRPKAAEECKEQAPVPRREGGRMVGCHFPEEL